MFPPPINQNYIHIWDQTHKGVTKALYAVYNNGKCIHNGFRNYRDALYLVTGKW